MHIKDVPEEIRYIAEVLDNKKALDILILKVDDLTIISDYFIVATATSTTHAQTLADEVQQKMIKQQDKRASRVEGESEGRWVVLDYNEALVHIFHKEEREFYQLERLWKVKDNFAQYPEEPK